MMKIKGHEGEKFESYENYSMVLDWDRVCSSTCDTSLQTPYQIAKVILT
jgi:hypothetical protein